METIATALLAIIAAALIVLIVQQHRRNVRQRPLERLAVAEERKRTARAIEHLERDVDWMAALTGTETPQEHEARTRGDFAVQRTAHLDNPADPVEPTVETRLDEHDDQLYVVAGPIVNPTVTDLRRGVHLEFRDLSFGADLELVVDATSRTAHVAHITGEGKRGSQSSVFHKIAIDTCVWNDPDAAAEQYAARLDRRNADAGVSIERNGKGDVTITTDPEPLPEGKTAIVSITDEDVETVAIVDTAALEAAASRYTSPPLDDIDPIEPCPAAPDKPRCCKPGGCIKEVADHRYSRAVVQTEGTEIVGASIQHLDSDMNVIEEQPASIDAAGRVTVLPGTCTWECPTPCVEHADPEAVNGRHPDGTRRCRTESCNGSPEPRKAWCAACLAETPDNPVQDAIDVLADRLEDVRAAGVPDDVDEDTEPHEPKPNCRSTIVPATETGLPGPRLASSSVAPLPTAGVSTTAPRTVPPGDNPVPEGWVSAKDALAIIGCSQPPLGKRLASGEIPGKKHPARNRHGFIWILERETCEAVKAEFAETGKLRVPV